MAISHSFRRTGDLDLDRAAKTASSMFHSSFVSVQIVEKWVSLVCAMRTASERAPVTEYADEIALFEHDADEDEGRGHRCEQQMPGAHRRGRPDPDHETEIDRVPDKTIEEWRPENRRRHLAADQIVGDLMQSEQLEMTDQEATREHDHP